MNRYVHAAMRAFYTAGIIFNSALLCGTNISLRRGLFKISWRQKWGKPRNRLRVWVIFDASGRVTAEWVFGSFQLWGGGGGIDSWNVSDSSSTFIERFLAWQFYGKASEHWATVKDFILDPGRFA